MTSLDLSVTIFPLFSIAMVSFVRKPLLIRKGLTVFQNALLLTKPFPVTLRKYAFLTGLVNLLQNFFNRLLEKKLTLARICLRNIYLNLFGGAHFYWRSLKTCNITKKTCLNYVQTVIFPWNLVYLNFRYCVCFEQEVLKL